MTAASKVLVTGAAGKLGTPVCRALLERGHQVVAADARHAAGFVVDIELGDLTDEFFAHRVVKGCDAVVHLGNHPNAFAGPSAQRLFSDNASMNANVFYAARDHGVRCIVFASSVQAMVPRAGPDAERKPALPYLPLDGDVPPNPGSNSYGLSKEVGERMLRLMTDEDPALSATVLRFPMLVTEWLYQRLSSRGPVPISALDLGECTAHLFIEEAAELVALGVEKRRPGYHQYFPAQTMDLSGYPLGALLEQHYPGVPVRRPLEDVSDLIDVSALSRDLDWRPRARLSVSIRA